MLYFIKTVKKKGKKKKKPKNKNKIKGGRGLDMNHGNHHYSSICLIFDKKKCFCLTAYTVA
jgi:hypothetical protein